VLFGILVVVAFALHQFPGHRAIRRAARVLLGVTLLQGALGIVAYDARLQASVAPLFMVISTVAHVATGGLTLAAAVVLGIQIRRNVRAATPQASEPEQAAVTP